MTTGNWIELVSLLMASLCVYLEIRFSSGYLYVLHGSLKVSKRSTWRWQSFLKPSFRLHSRTSTRNLWLHKSRPSEYWELWLTGNHWRLAFSVFLLALKICIPPGCRIYLPLQKPSKVSGHYEISWIVAELRILLICQWLSLGIFSKPEFLFI